MDGFKTLTEGQPAGRVRGRPGSQGCPGRERRRSYELSETRIDRKAGSRKGARSVCEGVSERIERDGDIP
jgi:hypothetical protein